MFLNLILFYSTIFLWTLFELFFTFFKTGTRFEAQLLTRGNRGRNENSLIGLGIVSFIFALLKSGHHSILMASDTLVWGCGIILGSLFFRWYAIQTLGNFFTADISIYKNHKIVEAGFYKIVRHPQYVFTIVTFLGLSVCCDAGFFRIFIFLFPALGLILKMVSEEKLLTISLGKKYENYKRRTYWIIPYIF